MILKRDEKFEEKLTWSLENDMRNGILEYKVEKVSTEELCVMILKNDAKFEQESTCHFKIDMKSLTNFDQST